MNKPRVSAIIPTYNRGWSIRDAVQSVLAQSYDDFELIVVDDGSTDNTKELLLKYENKIKYIYQDNKGVSSARNSGIKESRGKYISLLDSDDIWRKKKLYEQIKLIDGNPGIRVCYTNEIWYKNGKHLNQKKKHRKYSGNIFEKCLPLCIISASSVIIAREVFDDVGLFDEDFEVCEDYDLWLRIAMNYNVHFIDKKLIVKRGGHPGQLSEKYWGMDRFRIKSLLKLLKTDMSSECRKAVISEICKKSEILIKGLKKRGKEKEAQYYEKLLNISV